MKFIALNKLWEQCYPIVKGKQRQIKFQNKIENLFNEESQKNDHFKSVVFKITIKRMLFS